MNDDMVDVAIVGAGPYGLSVAAHLRAAGIGVRQFGDPMGLWRNAMPKGMFLKSQGFASNLSDPAGTHTLAAYCSEAGLPYRDYGLPVPLSTFVGYGEWFRDALVPDIEPGPVQRVTTRPNGFELTAGTEQCRSRAVVVATGVEHFPHMPAELADLPSTVSTHSSAHTDLTQFAGRRVVVVGAGQSALESAALLHEGGADVRVLVRATRVAWNGAPLALDRPLWQRLREPEAGLGSGWGTWFYSNRPDWFRHLRTASRVRRARTALGPAGASWLRERVVDKFPIQLGASVRWARESAGGVLLGVADRSGEVTEIAADHVIAATGYRPDVRRLAFLPDDVRARLRTVAGTPAVGPDYQSSVPGMYFVGPAVAPTFGPVMRFVFGTWHAAGVVGRALADRTERTAVAV